jgi:hypothetical protein
MPVVWNVLRPPTLTFTTSQHAGGGDGVPEGADGGDGGAPHLGFGAIAFVAYSNQSPLIDVGHVASSLPELISVGSHWSIPLPIAAPERAPATQSAPTAHSFAAME